MRGRSAFTLIELLIIIAIMGIMVSVAAIGVASGTGSARLKTATRGVLQMSRHARTMALLKQRPVELTFTSDGGIRIDPVVEGTTGIAPSMPKGANAEEDDGGEGESVGLTDDVVAKKYDSVAFSLAWDESQLAPEEITGTPEQPETDSDEDAVARGMEEPVKTYKIRYETNGRCLPYTVTVRPEGAEDVAGLKVVVNRFGGVKVEDEDE